ncbi:thioredoxin family protein [Evansella sp. AB-P1]|uniref:thioredoxin family protein n=1 Tax=Evansella sp. AB-P1 TaxID=3037653 RepID=UPI00241D4DE2|nr:thioredoxin family protein [Evansella sp. AB-P1]MDG5786815.1 thioredoxin family protein [Evansella sp. AB-P1]
MEVKLLVSANINGKIVEKRLMEVLNDIGMQVELEILYKDTHIIDGVFYTPTLIVNNQIVSSGKVLSKDEMCQFFM